MGKFFSLLLDILFPKRCLWCDSVVGFGSCETCEAAVGELLLPDTVLSAGNIHMDAVDIQEIHACYEYKTPVDSAVLRMKYGKEQQTAREFGRLLAEKYQRCAQGRTYDIVIPVPVSPQTLKQRGFNQSVVMAEELCRISGLTLAPDVLVKHKETQQQAGLSREQRRKNVKNAYAVKHAGEIAGKSVLLVDDVVTTGNTINECAKTLIKSGATVCGAICLASA